MKALTIGSAMIDTIAIIDPSRIERMIMANADASYLLLAEGQKTEAQQISTHCGGGAINTAVALARLGSDVATIAKLGQDPRAETIMARLIDEGVSTRWLVRAAGATTGASVLVASHDRNAAIFTHRGANALLTCDDLRDDAFAVGLVHVSSLSNRSADCFPDIVRRAKGYGAFVSTNPGIRQISSRATVLNQCIGQIDLFALNTAEAQALVPMIAADIGDTSKALTIDPAANQTELPDVARHGLAGGGFEIGLADYCAALIGQGLRFALLTDGRDGAYLADADAIRHCPAVRTDVAGTAGAGDAFVATLAHGLAKGLPADQALRRASCNSASVVAHVDTQTGMLDDARLASAVAAHADELRITTWPMPTR